MKSDSLQDKLNSILKLYDSIYRADDTEKYVPALVKALQECISQRDEYGLCLPELKVNLDRHDQELLDILEGK